METEHCIQDATEVLALSRMIVRRHELNSYRNWVASNELLARQLSESYSLALSVAMSVNRRIAMELATQGLAVRSAEEHERYLVDAIRYDRSNLYSDEIYWLLRMLISPTGENIAPLSLKELATYSMIFSRLSALMDSANPVSNLLVCSDALTVVDTVLVKYHYDTNQMHEQAFDRFQLSQLSDSSLPQLFVSREVYQVLTERKSVWNAFVIGTRRGVVVVG